MTHIPDALFGRTLIIAADGRRRLARCLPLLLLVAAISGCQTFFAACREAVGGAGWSVVPPPDWAQSKLAEIQWDEAGTTWWYSSGDATLKACRYLPSHGVPRCGGPVVANYSRVDGAWVGGLGAIHLCH